MSVAVSLETAHKKALDLQTSCVAAKCFGMIKGSRETCTFKGESRECYQCNGTSHTAAACKYKQEKCHACGKVGHLAKACRSKAKTSGFVKPKKGSKQSSQYRSHKVNAVDVDKSDRSEEDSFTLKCIKCTQSQMYRLGQRSKVHLRKVDPYTVDMEIDEKEVNFENDTGCCLTAISDETFKGIQKNNKLSSLKPVKIKLETYTGDPVKVIGATCVKAKYKLREVSLLLVVVERKWPQLARTRLAGGPMSGLG